MSVDEGEFQEKVLKKLETMSSQLSNILAMLILMFVVVTILLAMIFFYP